MELVATSRMVGKKSEAKKVRREGQIPAILYSKGDKGREIAVSEIEFKKILNSIEQGTLASKKITLTLESKKRQAIVKDIQYHVTSYAILHIDFVELHADVPVLLNIPIVCKNAMDCAGIKLGGVLRQVVRFLKVRCLPKDIPDHFELDVAPLHIGQALHLNVIPIPSGVRTVTDLKDVAVVIAKK